MFLYEKSISPISSENNKGFVHQQLKDVGDKARQILRRGSHRASGTDTSAQWQLLPHSFIGGQRSKGYTANGLLGE